MSDDTPTQRFPSDAGSGGDAATQRIGTGEIQEDLQEEKQKSKGLLIGLIVAGALLLIAIIVLVVFLLGRGPGDVEVIGTESPVPTDSANPNPSETPSETPAPTVEPDEPDEPEQPQQPAGPVVNSFTTGTSTVYCDDANTPGNDEQIDLNISWATTGGVRVAFGVDTDDAAAAPFFNNLPLSGNSNSNFPSGYSPFQFSCGPETHKYTITVVDGNGKKASKSVTVKDLSYALNN